jgi:hypothetical protein
MRDLSDTGYEPPRLKARRLRDLRYVSLHYAGALCLTLAMLLALAVDPDWQMGGNWLRLCVEVLLGIAIYLLVGGFVVAVSAERVSWWEDLDRPLTLSVRPYTLLWWPLLMAALIYRLAFPRA